MLDLRQVRERPEAVRAALARKGEPGALDALERVLSLDRQRRELLLRVETLRAQRNHLSGAVAAAGREDRQALVAEAKAVGASLKGMDADLDLCQAQLREAALELPNVPDAEVPDGQGDADNVELRRHGALPVFQSVAQAHWDIGARLGVLDFERSGKISGPRLTVFRGAGARLVRGLASFMLDLHVDRHRCTEVLPPFLVNTPSMFGTGNLPKFGGDAFRLEGADLWLIPTAEVPVTNLYRDEILSAEVLPIRHVAHTPCWRSEAGAAGRDTRGLIRQHQFDKVELVYFTRPDASDGHFEEIVENAETVLRALELPYRTVAVCAGDLGFSAARKYDLEVWMPSYERYVEISSCSNFRDFQARRANIRFRPAAQQPLEYVHTLNGSALAIGRTIAALLENGQQPDGSVRLPPALVPYLGIASLRPV